MFSLAVQHGRLLTRPYVPMLKERGARAGFFEPEQFARVRAHLKPHYHGIVSFAHITGWRTPSEILPLEWRQVDMQAGEVRLDPGTTKNGQGRVFPFTAELRTVLETQQRAAEALNQRGIITPHVFFHLIGKKAGRRITEDGFAKAWRAARVAAGCPERIVHDFRRTAVRNLVRTALRRNSESPVIVQAHPDAQSGMLMRVVDEAKLAGAPNVSVSTSRGGGRS